jgi:S-adenosylmethionine hydrolase
MAGLPRPIITLLTDFGTADGYVAEMKGVLLSLAPDAHLVDISHEVPPQDVMRARLTVSRYWRRFPPCTVHLVVVDPGVGTARAALAVASEGRFLVGPDNGVLSAAIGADHARVVDLDVPGGASPTFHGRDVFAPAAARLAHGEPLDILGRTHRRSVMLHTPVPVRAEGGGITGEIIAIDRFGNAITNLEPLPGETVTVAGWVVPVVRTFGDVAHWLARRGCSRSPCATAVPRAPWARRGHARRVDVRASVLNRRASGG